MFAIAATVLSLLAMALFYLSSPQQQWRATSLPAVPARIAGAVMTAAALVLWMHLHSAGTAVFILLTLAMSALVALPYIGALRNLLRARSRPEAGRS